MAIIKGKATKDGRIYSFKIRYTVIKKNELQIFLATKLSYFIRNYYFLLLIKKNTILIKWYINGI